MRMTVPDPKSMIILFYVVIIITIEVVVTTKENMIIIKNRLTQNKQNLIITEVGDIQGVEVEVEGAIKTPIINKKRNDNKGLPIY